MGMKNIWILVTILLISFCSFSQDETNRFVPHIFSGLVFSQVNGDTYAGFNKLGFHAGVGVKTKISDKIGLGLDMGYIQKGSRKPQDINNNDFSIYRMALHYVEVPVYMTYYQDRFDFDIGVTTEYLLKSIEERDGLIIRPEDFYPFKTVDFNYLIGFNYTLNEKWHSQLRYTHSLLPFRKIGNQGIGSLVISGQYHSVIMFTIIRQLAQ